MPLILILVECGIELIPKEIRNHPAVKKNISDKLYASQILDNALHHSAMRSLNRFEKRGRPDITHLCLLNALGSPANKSGNLILYMHTIRDKIFEINPKIRIAKNYNRFKGLMGNLLIKQALIDKNIPLISQFGGSLKDLIKKYKAKNILLFSRRGEVLKNYQNLFPNDLSENVIIIIGGFQKGSISPEIIALSSKIISISNHPLEAWIAVSKALAIYEITYNII